MDGRGIEGGSDAVVDRRLGYDLGDQFPIGPRVVTVVGRTRGATLFAGLANVYVSLDTAQAQGLTRTQVRSSLNSGACYARRFETC